AGAALDCDVVDVSAGRFASVALTRDGSVWTWGGGPAALPATDVPLRVPGIDAVVAIAAGDGHTLALRADGTVWAWGANGFGQLGDGTVTTWGNDGSTPAPVTGLASVAAIAAGSRHVLALLADGTVRAWGANASGALGDGTTTDAAAPVRVRGLDAVARI